MAGGHERGPTITYCPAIKVAFRVDFYEGKNCPQPNPWSFVPLLPDQCVYSSP